MLTSTIAAVSVLAGSAMSAPLLKVRTGTCSPNLSADQSAYISSDYNGLRWNPIGATSDGWSTTFADHLGALFHVYLTGNLDAFAIQYDNTTDASSGAYAAGRQATPRSPNDNQVFGEAATTPVPAVGADQDGTLNQYDWFVKCSSCSEDTTTGTTYATGCAISYGFTSQCATAVQTQANANGGAGWTVEMQTCDASDAQQQWSLESPDAPIA